MIKLNCGKIEKKNLIESETLENISFKVNRLLQCFYMQENLVDFVMYITSRV